MAEDIMCIRNKYASDYKKKKKEVLITIFHLNSFIKRDINGMKKRHSLLVESMMLWSAHSFVNSLYYKSSFSQRLHFPMKTKQEKRGIKLKTTLEISKSEYFGFDFVFYNPTIEQKGHFEIE